MGAWVAKHDFFNLIKICVHAKNQPHMTPFGSVWAHLPFWAPFGSVGPFWPFLAPFDPVLHHLAPFGTIWHHLDLFGPAWPHLALLGHSSIFTSRYFNVPIRQGVCWDPSVAIYCFLRFS